MQKYHKIYLMNYFVRELQMERTALTALPTLTSWLVAVYPSIYQSDHTNIKLYQHESKNILSENKMYHIKKKKFHHTFEVKA